MEMGGLWGGFYNISQVVARLAYINLLWVAFTLLGGVVFGIMPATTAVFALMRKWIQKKEDFPVLSTFWLFYKKDFLKSNLLGILLFLLGYLLYINLTLLQSDDILLIILRYAMLFFCILFLIMTLFLFPVYVHYRLKLANYLKMALLIGLSYPHLAALMVLGIIVLQYVCMLLPGIIPFFSISLAAYMMMWIANKAFHKLDSKEKGLNQRQNEAAAI